MTFLPFASSFISGPERKRLCLYPVSYCSNTHGPELQLDWRGEKEYRTKDPSSATTGGSSDPRHWRRSLNSAIQMLWTSFGGSAQRIRWYGQDLRSSFPGRRTMLRGSDGAERQAQVAHPARPVYRKVETKPPGFRSRPGPLSSFLNINLLTKSNDRCTLLTASWQQIKR